MKIFIGFSKPIGTSLFGSMISLVECRPYDHVYIRLQEPMDNEYMIFQASNMQVNLYSITNFNVAHSTIKEYEITITQEQYQLLWRFVKSMLGVPYSLKEDFGILLMKIFHLSGQPFNDGNRAEFCSKLGATVCNLLGIEMSEDVSQIDPSGLDTKLSSLGIKCSYGQINTDN